MPVRNFEWDDLEDAIDEELDDDGNTLVEYDTEPDGTPIGMSRDGHYYTFHSDGFGNVIALTDENGDVTDTFSHTAFGKLVSRTGTTVCPFQWQGMNGYYTSPDGTVNVRRRQYSPALARWTSPDPLVHHMERLQAILGVDLNAYRYAFNNPVMFTDPSGLSASLVDYIPGRGIMSVSLGALDPNENSALSRLLAKLMLAPRLTSIGGTNYKLFRDAKGCCLCEAIGILQIVRERILYHGFQWRAPTWRLDGGVPYPFPRGGNIGYPCSKDGPKNNFRLNDRPSAPLLGLESVSQEFESCVYCMSGPAGPKTSFGGVYYGDLLAELTNVTVYGCIKWSQVIKRTKAGIRIIRTIEGLPSTETSDDPTVFLQGEGVISSPNYAYVSPSSDWETIAKQNLSQVFLPPPFP